MINAQRVYTMLGNANLWETAAICHEILAEAGIPHSVCGGLAVCLHGYQRNTVDLDLIIRSEDSSKVRQVFKQAGLSWNARTREFRSEAGVSVQFLLAGDRAGRDQEVKLPDPADPQSTEIVDDLPVLRLSKLIEVKLACGAGNIRRTHKDFADVVELIALHGLDSSFSRFLHKSLRKTYRELVKRAHGDD